MVTSARMTRADDLGRILSEVVSELVMTGVDNGDGVIALPQSYPGGAPVVVRLRRDANTFIVSDNGAGFLEAEHLGGSHVYNRAASRIADEHGVRYDGNMMFTLDVSRDWIANAIIHVGSASRRAVEVTAERLTKERTAQDAARLRDLLRLTFNDRASFDVEFRGRSTKQWEFAAMVRQVDHWTLFDLVSPHHVSINSAIVKLQDISRLDDAPRGLAILTNPAKMDPSDIALISDAASQILPIDMGEAALRLAA